jgi:hypothetical protein
VLVSCRGAAHHSLTAYCVQPLACRGRVSLLSCLLCMLGAASFHSVSAEAFSVKRFHVTMVTVAATVTAAVACSRGCACVHAWGGRGRWTFTKCCMLASQPSAVRVVATMHTLPHHIAVGSGDAAYLLCMLCCLNIHRCQWVWWCACLMALMLLVWLDCQHDSNLT